MKVEQNDNRPAASIWRSIYAVSAGLATVIILALLTDQMLHLAQVYPPWGMPMHDTGDNLIALSYRLVYSIFGAYLAARLAPSAPLGHALALGVIGAALACLGAVASHEAAPATHGMSPAWFNLALMATALPTAWLGGRIGRAHRTGSP